MKKTFLVAALALLTVGMVSCKKEENNISKLRFTATMESGAKTSLSGQNLTWDQNEKILVFGTAGGALFAVDPDESDASVATFECVSGNPGSGSYKAFYPPTLSNDGVNIVFRAVQSTTGNFANYPMYAESSTTDLLFKNICSVLRLNLQKNDASVTKIQIVTDHYQTGTFRIQMNEDGVPELVPANTTDHTKIVTLEFDDAVSIATARDFFIYLIPGSYTHIVINLYNGSNLFASKTFHSTTSPLQFNRSAQKSLTFGNAQLSNDQTGALSGLFTVNSNGKKVMFSKSNLFYSPTSNNYSFKDEQYIAALFSSSNSVISGRYYYQNGSKYYNMNSEDISLLGIAVAQQTSFNVVNGGGLAAANDWFCMSPSEWSYLIKTRSVNFHRYSHVRVIQGNSTATLTYRKSGLMLFPDDFVWPLDQSKMPTRFDAQALSDWNSKEFTYADWKVLESAGCVFLPVTGRVDRSSNPSYMYISDYTSRGYYWTTTSGLSTWFTARSITFPGNQNGLDPRDLLAIRLVKEAPAASTANDAK